jgi:hypothetical protein
VIKYKLAMAAAVLVVLPVGQNLQAALANTGAYVVAGVDQNWNVTSAFYTGPAAYLATPSTQWPFSPAGPWVADDATSSWITYSSPLNLHAPATTYTYTETFTLASAENLAIRFLSDNESSVFLVNGNQQTLIGQNGPALDPSTFSTWSPYVDLNLGSGTYSFEIQVVNDPWSGSNPTGVRFEEEQIPSLEGFPNGDTSVPEPTTVVAGALMLVPLGIGFLRKIYKGHRTLNLN